MKKQVSFLKSFLSTLLLIVISFPSTGRAQTGFNVVQCQTEEDVIALIDTVLLYNVADEFKQNISFTGNPKAVGYYSGGGLFGFDNAAGIALSTGFSGSLDNPNTCSGANASSNNAGGGDPDLADLTNMSIQDAVVIEFDIKRLDDSVFLSYVFGSEEYHEWVNTQFNDVFGFFLSGPGIEGPYTNGAINIATVPGTDLPVSIDNINCGQQNAFCQDPPGNGPNCDLLYSNTDPSQGSFEQCVLDAYTYPLSAAHDIQPAEWYHVKLAIGDAGDAIYDSGILLEKGSIVANPFDFQVQACQTEEDVISLVDTVLLSHVAGINKDNITFTGDPKAVGYFHDGGFLGLARDKGILLSNGLVSYAANLNECNTSANANANNGGAVAEPDLKQLSGGGAVYDAGYIEFDFRPSTDSVKLNYVFASEEYHELVNSGNNDVFGIFLSGPGIDGEFTNNAINMGTIPGSSDPVNAGTVNFGEGGVTCTGKPDSCVNCQYMLDNSQSEDTAFYFLIYDGYTTAMDASAEIQPGQWYHVKISIADIDSPGFDSGIFLSEGTITGDTVITDKPEIHPDDWCRIMPNPAGDYVIVKVMEKNAQLKISTLDGRFILEQPLTEGDNAIHLSLFPKGMYIVIVESAGRVYREKLLHY